MQVLFICKTNAYKHFQLKTSLNAYNAGGLSKVFLIRWNHYLISFLVDPFGPAGITAFNFHAIGSTYSNLIQSELTLLFDGKDCGQGPKKKRSNRCLNNKLVTTP